MKAVKKPTKRKKAKEPSIEEIASKIDRVVKEENIDVDKIVAEAIEQEKH